MKKILGILVVIAIIVIAITSGNKKDGTQKKVAILLPADIQLIDEIVQGIKMSFKDAGYEEGKDVVFDVQSSHGDNATLQSLASKFVNGNYDLLLPMGTGASQAILNLEKTKPIVFAAVTDPKTAGLVDDPQKPGKNITGTSDVTLYKESLELLKKLAPNAKKVGVLHNPGEANSVFGLSETKKYATELGLTLEIGGVNSTAEVYTVAKSLASKVDVFYVLPDVTVVSGIDGFIKASLENKKPLLVFGEGDVEKGGLASLGTNYVKVGERSGEIAIRVLEGENPGNIPVLGVTDADVFINTKTAEAIGITISETLLKSAKKTY